MKLFFVLSGEHPKLPLGELKAILEAEGVRFKLLLLEGRVALLEAPIEAGFLVCKRAAMAKLCFMYLFAAEAIDAAEQLAREVDWSFMRARKSFAVRVSKLGPGKPTISTRELERAIGKAVKEVTGIRVDLERPEVVLGGVVQGDKLYFGVLLGTREEGAFSNKEFKKRPFLRTAVMKPKLSRVLVNLSRAKRRECFLDPFCGGGSLLIEAKRIGCDPVVGIDADAVMLSGARKNLLHYGMWDVELALGDACSTPLKGASAIACDPPYGRGTLVWHESLASLIEDFVFRASELLSRGSYLCFITPSELDPRDCLDAAGLMLLERYSLRVHGSLTRVIHVARK